MPAHTDDQEPICPRTPVGQRTMPASTNAPGRRRRIIENNDNNNNDGMLRQPDFRNAGDE